jgi:hypothetical protein
MLTKDDITAFRKADCMSVHLSKDHPNGLVRLIKRKAFNAGPFEGDKEYLPTTVKVVMETMRGQEALDAGTARCFELVYFYHEQGTPASSIIKTLRVGDDVTLSFYPDCHSNGYVAAQALHADCLYLKVRRGGKHVATWCLDQSVCPNNSARMCYGVTPDRDYLNAAEERRSMGV